MGAEYMKSANFTKSYASTAAFTMIELAIVLVIIGLLVGGILIGQTVIRNAQLKSIVEEVEKYKSAANSFRQKYQALPGDMADATSFWGTAPCNGTAGTGTQTCNGNNNGYVQGGIAEMFTFWQQLAIAGMIEGPYTGVQGPSGNWDNRPGTNCPKGKIKGSGFGIVTWNDTVITSDPQVFDGVYANIFVYGSWDAMGVPLAGIITPEEAKLVDTKSDDGTPSTGNIVAWKPFASWQCITSSDPATAAYNLTNKTNQCSLIFKTGL